MMMTRPFLVVTCAALFLASCAGDLDGAEEEYAALPVSPAIRPANVHAPAPGATTVMPTGMGCDGAVAIMQTPGKCGTTVCHGTATDAPLQAVADFSGDAAQLPAKLKAFMSTVSCAGMAPVLDATNPAQSLLITKLSDPPPCGVKMPQAGSITAEEAQCITDWALEAAAAP